MLPRLVMFAAMAAMFVVALAVPGAFGDQGVVWALGYLAVRLLHAALFWVAARGDRALARNVLFLVGSMVPGGGLILLGAIAFDGTTRDLLWVAAVVLDYGIVVLGADASGWRVHAEHFAERFGLVMIIAFGESIVAIGIGAEDLDGASAKRPACGRSSSPGTRTRCCTCRWSPASSSSRLGTKKVLEHPEDPLEAMPAVALCAGLALYALAHVAFRLRNTGTRDRAHPRVPRAGPRRARRRRALGVCRRTGRGRVAIRRRETVAAGRRTPSTGS